MSTVSVSNIKNASSSVNNAVTTSGGDLTNAAGVSFMSANKNLLYNGAMQVAQRGTSTASITTAGYYTADRWNANVVTLGTWTQSVENDAPSGSGLRKSLKMLCTTADAAPAAGDRLQVFMFLEGQDLQRVAKGTSSAQQLTLSFWVKSNKTGTYVAELYDEDNSRQVSAAYTISASATWEKKTITFPADTTGVWDNDNAASLSMSFWLGAGSDFTSGTLNTSWAANTNANRVVGQTNLAAATNNYWQVTGVQLEVGPVATSFEFKSYGQELRECQRYYEKSYNVDTAPGANTLTGVALATAVSDNGNSEFVHVRFAVAKRSASYTCKAYTSGGTADKWTYARSGVAATDATATFAYGSTGGFSVYVNTGAAWTAGSIYGHWVSSDEL